MPLSAVLLAEPLENATPGDTSRRGKGSKGKRTEITGDCCGYSTRSDTAKPDLLAIAGHRQLVCFHEFR
jgi:hypothetical protein